MKKMSMRFLAANIVFSIISLHGFAQNSNVGIGTLQPDESALLDVSSTSKGLLVPRMTEEQKNGIKNPSKGLLIFQTDNGNNFYFYNGNMWKPISNEEAKAVTTLDINGWALDGNAVSSANKAAATSASFIGTPANVPLNFRIGLQSAGKVDQATRNSFYGFESGKVATAFDNVGMGYFSLRATTTGRGNMGIGTYALIKNLDGEYNVGIGTSSMQENVTGDYNIGIGVGALRSVLGDRNVGIGVFSGFASTGSRNVFIGNEAGRNETGSNKLYISNSNTTTPLVYGDFSAKYVTIGDITPALRTQGTATGGYNLLVKGGILTEKVKVALAAAGADWADYVFEPTYKANMMSLEEVEAFTIKNKHLPNVPSAEEMVKTGLDVSQTSKMFMEKIEELTLYMIEMNKEIKALKEENAKLKK
jgi:hypothetical protein